MNIINNDKSFIVSVTCQTVDLPLLGCSLLLCQKSFYDMPCQWHTAKSRTHFLNIHRILQRHMTIINNRKTYVDTSETLNAVTKGKK